MKKLVLIFLLLISQSGFSQKILNVNFDELETRIQTAADTLMVLNFWATWCKPCIDELPYFEHLHKKYGKEKVKVLLVNLDFNSKVETVAQPFVYKNQLRADVIHIIDTDPNTWINRIDKNWSGAIPATVMYKAGSKIFFYEGGLEKNKLDALVEEHKPKSNSGIY